MMKKTLRIILATLFFVACNPFQKQGGESESITLEEIVDSLIVQIDEVIDNIEEEPVGIEEFEQQYFEDFVFNFFQNRRLQISSIRFPLTYIAEGKVHNKTRKEWKDVDMLSNRDYYTVLFDRDEQIELERDTTITKIYVEWCYLEAGKKRRYEFIKSDERWLLTGIEDCEISNDANSDFLAFYHQFSTDLQFQHQHLAESIGVVTSDPTDEFESISGIIEQSQWEAFRPELPRDTLTTIDYGQHSLHANTKIIVKKGFSNGMIEILRFRKLNGKWRLVSFES